MIEPPLPKQMRHWFNRAGIYQHWTHGTHRCWRQQRYFDGSSRSARFRRADAGPGDKRHFRVLSYLNRMDICDGDFDRWANSLGASISPIPRDEGEFRQALSELYRKAERNLMRREAS